LGYRLTLVEKVLKSKMILVCYDFDATDEGNIERALMRNELTGKPFYARMMTQSVYYLPESMAPLENVRKWAKSKNAEITVFGNVDADLHDRKQLAKDYVRFLKDLVKEMREIAKSVKNDLQDFEENIDDPDQTLRGWHTKISGITNRFEELRKAISRVGDDDDELDLEMMSAYIARLQTRYAKVLAIKEKQRK